ncbi:MAG: bifunctional oligoribonuclease/PAP phosphatase NrnA [Candidatus Methylomirabilales bacterium]
MKTELEAVVQALAEAPSVAVLSHVFPEGDAIGASLAAMLALEAAGKRAGAYNAGPLPAALRHLPAGGRLRPAPERPYACYLVLDTTEPERTGGLLDGRAPGSRVLNVDHHPGNTRFGDVNWVDPQASSAGEMVYRICRTGGFPLSPDVAANLYAAILTDTGGFRYSNTTPEALRTGAALVAAGAVPEAVGVSLSAHRDPREFELLRLALAELRVSPDGTLGWITVTRTAQQAAGVGLEAAEDFVQYPRSLEGVRVALAFKEAAPDEVKVSLRSHGTTDVAALARRFGGGGHRNAAGCTLRADLATAQATMLQAAAELVRA